MAAAAQSLFQAELERPATETVPLSFPNSNVRAQKQVEFSIYQALTLIVISWGYFNMVSSVIVEKG